jgi:hypothetical protein
MPGAVAEEEEATPHTHLLRRRLHGLIHCLAARRVALHACLQRLRLGLQRWGQGRQQRLVGTAQQGGWSTREADESAQGQLSR